MKIFPAIDLRDGKAVRLYQGDYNQMTVYSDSPVEVAKPLRQKAQTVCILSIWTERRTAGL